MCRLPLDELPALAAVTTLSWLLSSAVLGTYKGEADPDENPLSNAFGWPIFAVRLEALMTLVLSHVSPNGLLLSAAAASELTVVLQRWCYH